jgi:N-acetylglucosaminyl-diphospho-decaprenol L-rhamnosyltransferase
MSAAGRGGLWTEERSDEGRGRTRAAREANREAASAALVSVVVVSYNTRQLTLRGLAGLRAAVARADVAAELVVVDNASTDGSADAVQAALPDATVVRMADNVGFGRAVNRGAAVATGEWLLLVNPDTEPVGDLVGALVRYATAHPGHGIYTGRTLHADGTDDGRSVWGLPSLWGYACFATGLSTVARRSRWCNPEALPHYDRSVAREVPAVSGCLLLIERVLFEKLGGFSPWYFMYSEDIDLCTRAAAYGARPVLVPDAKLTHVGGASSSSVTKRVMLLRGKSTYLRLHWSKPKAAAGLGLLATGVLVRAIGGTVLRRPGWAEVWRQRSVWLPGWPDPGTGTSENAATVRSA